MNEKILKNIQDGEIKNIKDFCENGKNIEKLMEIMTLGDDEKTLNKTGNSGLLIAAKNAKFEILEFIITSALADEKSKKLLVSLLLAKTRQDTNILHEAAITPKNGKVIQFLCNTAKELANAHTTLKDYPNSTEGTFGKTPLHFAVQFTQFENYLALQTAGANLSAEALDKKIPIDMLIYAKNHEAVPVFMVCLMQNTQEETRFF